MAAVRAPEPRAEPLRQAGGAARVGRVLPPLGGMAAAATWRYRGDPEAEQPAVLGEAGDGRAAGGAGGGRCPV